MKKIINLVKIITFERVMLLILLLIISLTVILIQNLFFGMSMFSCLSLFFIGLVFDMFVIKVYPRLRRKIRKKYQKSFYLQQTLPFLILFGSAYPFKVALLYFFGLLTFMQSLESFLLVVLGVSAFGWLFRPFIIFLYGLMPSSKKIQST